jgi:hypothetical protein
VTQGFLILFYHVFVRKKNNKSGVVSIQVISKVNGKSKLVRTIGSSNRADEIALLFEKGKQFVSNLAGQFHIDFSNEKSRNGK